MIIKSSSLCILYQPVPHERYSGDRYRGSSVRQGKFPAGKASRTPQGSTDFWSSRWSYLFETCSNTVTPAQQQQQQQLSTKCSLLPMRAVPHIDLTKAANSFTYAFVELSPRHRRPRHLFSPATKAARQRHRPAATLSSKSQLFVFERRFRFSKI